MHLHYQNLNSPAHNANRVKPASSYSPKSSLSSIAFIPPSRAWKLQKNFYCKPPVNKPKICKSTFAMAPQSCKHEAVKHEDNLWSFSDFAKKWNIEQNIPSKRKCSYDTALSTKHVDSLFSATNTPSHKNCDGNPVASFDAPTAGKVPQRVASFLENNYHSHLIKKEPNKIISLLSAANTAASFDSSTNDGLLPRKVVNVIEKIYHSHSIEKAPKINNDVFTNTLSLIQQKEAEAIKIVRNTLNISIPSSIYAQ